MEISFTLGITIKGTEYYSPIQALREKNSKFQLGIAYIVSTARNIHSTIAGALMNK